MVFPPCCCAEHHVSADRSLTFVASKEVFVIYVISVQKKKKNLTFMTLKKLFFKSPWKSKLTK